MMKNTRTGVVCLSLLVAGIFVAAPSSRRMPLDPSFAQLGRAEDEPLIEAETAAELDLKGGEACSGTPDHAKGIIEEPSKILRVPSTEQPVFGKDRRSAVLSLIHYPWEDLGYSIVFLGSRSGYRAMTLTARRRIEVYVRPGEGLMHQAFDLAHELGHAYDLKYNTEETRRKWRELRGIRQSTPWFGCDACPDYNTPAGDFAETFAYLLLGPGNYHSVIAPMPKTDQLEELASLCKIERLSSVLTARMIKKAGSTAVQTAKADPDPVKEEKKAEAVSVPATNSAEVLATAKTTPEETNQPEVQNPSSEIASEAEAKLDTVETEPAQEQTPDPGPAPEPAPTI